MSWVLRDGDGAVRMHNRRAFLNVDSQDEAKFSAVIWTAHVMRDHRIYKLILATEAAELVNAVNMPKAWPSFAFQSAEILSILENFESWKLILESHCTNRGASLIAQNAAKSSHLQSYVAIGAPCWLENLFENERSFVFV
ncbi:hypothetical protein V5N11_005930 [Cardamine amara subsp. amara]|uniref:RNase H type-1 domain-containing protein n=1 Tax=Cardamine amara subsp. amara TaxID=228776 RepID=A0ABD0Z1B1_CARAN